MVICKDLQTTLHPSVEQSVRGARPDHHRRPMRRGGRTDRRRRASDDPDAENTTRAVRMIVPIDDGVSIRGWLTHDLNNCKPIKRIHTIRNIAVKIQNQKRKQPHAQQNHHASHGTDNKFADRFHHCVVLRRAILDVMPSCQSRTSGAKLRILITQLADRYQLGLISRVMVASKVKRRKAGPCLMRVRVGAGICVSRLEPAFVERPTCE